MGKPVENEVILRTRAKEVRALIIEKHDIEKAVEIIKEHEEILTFDFGRNKYLSLLPTIRLEKGLKNKYYYLEKIIQAAVHLYARNKNYEELVYFAAASCDTDNLRRCMELILKENFSKTREGDTILLFFVKFANLENSKYIETLKILVNEYKLPVNQADYRDHTPIIILLNKYNSLQSKGISRYNALILNAVSMILARNNVDLQSHRINGNSALDIIESHKLTNILEDLKMKNHNISRFKSEIEDETNVLFSLLAQKKENEFLQTARKLRVETKIFDLEDGNNTLLQLACEKNLPSVVTFLIQEGADLSKTTKRNRKPPLEIAARRNFYSIFKELLNANSLIIDGKLFTVFLLNRGRQIKTKYFDEILCYDGLKVDIAYENGNTPLHYAIIFDNTEAMLKLLKRGASLLEKNECGKAPIDYITREDLELYLDQCILLDNHNKPHGKKYELRFDFNGLLQNHSSTDQELSEVEVTSKICSSDKLKSLATHPLILTFMEAKWSLTSPLYKTILKMYGFLFLYYFALVTFVGHMTFLYLITVSSLIFFTLQPSIDLKSKKSYFSVFIYVGFAFFIYFFIENNNICAGILSATLLYHFLRYHLYFSKYQAFTVNGIRKITPHALAVFSLYCIRNYEAFIKNSIIVFPFIIYMLVVTYSFNALVDSVRDIEHSFKCLYNRNTLDFIKFAEYINSKFIPIIKSPFIRYNLEIVSPKSKKNRDNKFYLNFYLNRNKFVNENFHFLKLDSVTVKSLQDFVLKVTNNKQEM